MDYEDSEWTERRQPRAGGNRWGFNKQINLANVALGLGMIFAFAKFGGEMVDVWRESNAKIAVMWTQFEHDQPDKAEQFNAIYHPRFDLPIKHFDLPLKKDPPASATMPPP